MSQTEELSRREEQFFRKRAGEFKAEDQEDRAGTGRRTKKILRVCMNITGKIIQRWTSTDMRIMTTSRLCCTGSMRIRKSWI